MSLTLHVLSQGQLNLTNVWYSVSPSDSIQVRFQLGNCWGDSHGLTIEWVHVGDPLHVHKHTTTLPSGNVGEYNSIDYLTPSPSIVNSGDAPDFDSGSVKTGFSKLS
jgi:hypothetical protein